MNKRDTQELAAIFHTTVEEVRQARKADAEEKNIAKTVESAPSVFEEDPAAWYCRNRTGGVQHSFMFNGEKYCFLQRKCRYQIQEGKARKCNYRGQ